MNVGGGGRGGEFVRAISRYFVLVVLYFPTLCMF